MAKAQAQKYREQLFNARSATLGTDTLNVKYTYRLPDPPILTDGKDPTFDSWNTMIRDKLRNNTYIKTSQLVLYTYSTVPVDTLISNYYPDVARNQLIPLRIALK